MAATGGDLVLTGAVTARVVGRRRVSKRLAFYDLREIADAEPADVLSRCRDAAWSSVARARKAALHGRYALGLVELAAALYLPDHVGTKRIRRDPTCLFIACQSLLFSC